MMERAVSRDTANWFQSTARQRIGYLLDDDSFVEFLGPTARVQSPHLHLFDLPAAFDDGVAVGRGLLNGVPVLLAAQEGQFLGGTFGEVGGAKITGLLRAACLDEKLPRVVLLLLDSGGVRLQEANAGEIAVAEIMRAIAQARSAGISVVAVAGGRSGAFGGAGLTASTCARIVVSEQGRLAVTGPEVIETNKGVEEFNAADKALVWSVVGGKNRCLIGGADAFAPATIKGFRDAILAVLANVPAFTLATLDSEHRRLQARLDRLDDCTDAVSMYRALGVGEPDRIRDMDDDAFAALAASMTETIHDAR
jgi:malonate decarboxylase beta subunit